MGFVAKKNEMKFVLVGMYLNIVSNQVIKKMRMKN